MRALAHFLTEAPIAGAQAVFDHDLNEVGFAINASRLWTHRPDLCTGLLALLGTASDPDSAAPRAIRDAVHFGRPSGPIV